MQPRSQADCAWCGAPLRGGEQLWGRTLCPSCGVATTEPWPTEEELDLAYGGHYRPRGGRFSGLGDAILRCTRARLSDRLNEIAPPGPVLDVGAGDGTLLAALRGCGRKAVGLERESDRPGTRTGDISNEERETWAAIVFWHSLEHLREPGAAVDAAAVALQREGVVVIAVPNSASLQAHLFGSRWFALDPPRHLVHLTAAALLRRLREDGLRVERVSHLRGGQVVFGWLHGIVGLLPGHPDFYDAIRRPQARSAPLRAPIRWAILAIAVLALPLAASGAALEVMLRRGGTVYVEARRA
jgi:SAM-dependent methyltransferase